MKREVTNLLKVTTPENKAALTEKVQCGSSSPLAEESTKNGGLQDVPLQSLRKEVERLKEELRAQQKQGGRTLYQRQWKAISKIMDRVFAILFLILNFITILVFLPMPSDEWWSNSG